MGYSFGCLTEGNSLKMGEFLKFQAQGTVNSVIALCSTWRPSAAEAGLETRVTRWEQRPPRPASAGHANFFREP